MMGLLYIIIGGFFEPAWVFALEKGGREAGSRRAYVWYALSLLLMFFSLMFLSLGMRTENIGISYAIWTAVGSIVTIALSRVFLDEKLSLGKMAAIMMILIGISGLELAGGL